MAAWDAADLLARFNDQAARPTSDEYTDAKKYALLADAQDEVYRDVVGRVPHVLYGAPAALTPAADLKSFTFGTDVLPIGQAELYPNLSSIPDAPLIEGVDYLSEGLTIRTLNDRAWTGGTIYARFAQLPAAIASGQDATLTPKRARQLIVHKAVQYFGERGASNLDLAAIAEAKYTKALREWLLIWKTQFYTQGSGSGAGDPLAWYKQTADLG